MPEPCPLGYYSNSTGSTGCKVCPQGYSCEVPSEKPIKCPTGTYSSQGNITCSSCPAGYHCSNGAPPVMCAIGEYSAFNDELCRSCPVGHKCPIIGMSKPIHCEIGYYNNMERQINCKMCESGRSCANRNGSEICPSGTYSPYGVMECLPCQSGNYSLSGSSICLICPAGKSCVDPSQNPQPCPSGYFSNIGDGSCKLCDVGTKSFSNGTGCLPCDPGYFCPNPM